MEGSATTKNPAVKMTGLKGNSNMENLPRMAKEPKRPGEPWRLFEASVEIGRPRKRGWTWRATIRQRGYIVKVITGFCGGRQQWDQLAIWERASEVAGKWIRDRRNWGTDDRRLNQDLLPSTRPAAVSRENDSRRAQRHGMRQVQSLGVGEQSAKRRRRPAHRSAA
jgi:hypothetical protein